MVAHLFSFPAAEEHEHHGSLLANEQASHQSLESLRTRSYQHSSLHHPPAIQLQRELLFKVHSSGRFLFHTTFNNLWPELMVFPPMSSFHVKIRIFISCRKELSSKVFDILIHLEKDTLSPNISFPSRSLITETDATICN